MTADAARALCAAAGLTVLDVQTTPRLVGVTVAPFGVEPGAVRTRLTKRGAGGVAFSFGDGSVPPVLWFSASDGADAAQA